jgi:branched-chain amino acid transport system substrate-binding protein
MKARWTRWPVALAAAGLLAPVLATAAAAPASAAPAPITLAVVTSQSGPAAPEDQGVPAAFEARLALQNAQGGVNGHKLVPLVVDDQTSPTAVVTGVQDALSKGAFGIVSESALFFAAAKYPEQAGVPVTGFYGDGPEWGTQPYTNMFAADEGSLDPKYPVNTLQGTILKKYGGTTVATYGYSISPSSTRATIGTARSFEHAGGKVGVEDTSLPFGTTNFTTPAVIAKQKHVDALWPNLDDNSNFALATALKQAGVNIKAAVYATGYDPAVIHSPTWQDLQGGYFLSLFRPWSLPNNATRQMSAALQKYAHYSPTQFPTFMQYEAWVGADLMIKGLQMAGKNPTQAGVIKALRGVKSYNANGLLPITINYSTAFGHDPAKQCTWIVKAVANGFVPTSSQPVCGTDIPGTSTASSS